jgi:methylase of polypeptide subunit release factors
MLSRIKFEIEELVNEILDKIPVDTFISQSTTFADLQIGGGQFIIGVVNRLKSFGHSDENIRGRVFAFTENKLYYSYVMGRYSNLPVTFDIYKEEINMKFDVVLGNPPYQENDEDGKSKGGGKNVLRGYSLFVKKSMDVLKDNGTLLYVIPQGWQVKSHSLWKMITSDYCLSYIDNNNEKIKGHFNNVGSTFCIINVVKQTYNNETFVEGYESPINLNNIPTLPDSGSKEDFKMIIEEFTKEEGVRLNFIGDSTFHYQKASTKENVKSERDEEFNYPIKHTSSKTLYSRVIHPRQNDNKVIISDSGYLSPFYDNGVFGVTQHSPFILVNSEDEGSKIVNYLNSEKIKTLLSKTKKSGFFNLNVINSLKYD